MQPTATQGTSQSWPDDHDPLLTPARGPLLAFDQPAPRHNRIPRIAPRRGGLYRRLHRAWRVALLRWRIADLGATLTQLRDEIDADTRLLTRLALTRRQCATVAARHRANRRALEQIKARQRALQVELDTLEALA